jgi:hypothetical protein
VFDWERFSANDGIGEVQVPLWPPDVDLAMETDRWEELDKITSDKNKKPILKQKRPAAMRSHSTASSVSSVRSSISSKHDAGRATVNSMHDVGRSSVSSMHDVGRSSVSSMHDVGRATSGQGFHHQESSGTGFNQGGSVRFSNVKTVLDKPAVSTTTKNTRPP